MFDPDTHMLFDIDLARQRSNDNPVFYVQYANARISNVFRTARRRTLKRSRDSVELLDFRKTGGSSEAADDFFLRFWIR